MLCDDGVSWTVPLTYQVTPISIKGVSEYYFMCYVAATLLHSWTPANTIAKYSKEIFYINFLKYSNITDLIWLNKNILFLRNVKMTIINGIYWRYCIEMMPCIVLIIWNFFFCAKIFCIRDAFFMYVYWIPDMFAITQ